MKPFVPLGLLAATGLLGEPSSAHHSFAMYDQSRTVTLTATVTDWQWTNPHTELYLLVTSLDGKPLKKPESWRIEGQSPVVMRDELKVQRDQFRPGDKVSVTIHPLREGSKGGSFVSVTLPDGRIIGAPHQRLPP